MDASSPSISDAELHLLKLLWERGPGTVRDLLDIVRDEGRDWAYTTVQTLLLRLEQKGFVTTDKKARAHVFVPRVTREVLLDRQLNDLAERVCDGASAPLVLSLVKGGRFSREELARFRHLLDELEDGEPPVAPAGS
ncbi:MAG: BlaI/MecI/CopY family transcriptional regulator [Planctomycetes bacterium]|nr:BlaI/MecI/CopY family transcriptional regulator [Planctomycetota bacterium]